MRIPALFLLLTACTHVHSANDVQLFEVKVALNERCQISANTSSGTVLHNFDFEQTGECRIVTHAHTSIPSTYFINGAYVLFIEKNHPKDDDCYSEYTAIAINKNQQLLTTPLIKKSGTCFQSQELNAFQYFSAKLVPHQATKQ